MARGQTTEANLEAQIALEERSFKQQLAARPKVKISVPRDPNNPNDTQIVVWNGVVYSIPRGVTVEVPDLIADIWQESYNKTDEINMRIEESVNKEVRVM
jgi:hypothetical protein